MRQKSTRVKENRKTLTGSGDLGWDAMIRDARKRIADLHYSIEVFEKKKQAGDYCPAEKQFISQDSEQQHSV